MAREGSAAVVRVSRCLPRNCPPPARTPAACCSRRKAAPRCRPRRGMPTARNKDEGSAMSNKGNRQAGFSMIEVLVTLLVFTVGLLGLAALQLNALQGTSDSAQRSQAAAVLQDLAER